MSALDIAKKALDAFNRHDAAAFAALYADDAVAPDPQYPEPLRGKEAIREDVAAFFEAFPDAQARGDNFVMNGDTVAFEVEVSGTHRGPLITPNGPIPATNRPVRMTGGRFVRVNAQDLITDCRRYYDMAGIMAQLGLL